MLIIVMFRDGGMSTLAQELIRSFTDRLPRENIIIIVATQHYVIFIARIAMII